jgi:hypothetical protein
MERTYIMSSLESALFTKYCSGYQIEKNEIGGTCNTYGVEEKCIEGFGGET